MADIIKKTHTVEITVDFDTTEAVADGLSDSRKISIPIKLDISGDSGASVSQKWSAFIASTYNSSDADDADYKPFWRLLFQPTGWLDSPDSSDESDRPITVEQISASYTQKVVREFENIVS